MSSPLQLPEIISHVGSYLYTKQLATCTLVCKTWNNSLTPALYRKSYVDLSSHRSLSLETINRHADSIRYLNYIGCTDPKMFSPECTNLLSLNISKLWSRELLHPREISILISQLIVKNSSTLETFTILREMLLSSKELWIALAQCPNLKNIHVDFVSLRDDSMEFWIACSKVEHLQINGSMHILKPHNIEATIPSVSLPRLQSLRINITENTHDIFEMDIILSAPNLKSLEWYPNFTLSFPVDDFRRVMQQRKLPLLQSFKLFSHHMEDNDIALALDAMTDAKDLVMKWSYFSDNSLRSLLSRHSMTIRTLIFCRYEFPTGSMVQTILSTCPSLEVVEFSSIGGIDLVKLDRVITNDANGDAAITENIVLAKDWVCLGLKSLSINIKMSRPLYGPGQDNPIDAQQLEKQQKLEQVHAFRQLSRLEQLTKLDIKCLETLGKSLDLRLESFGGHLEKLASLKRLEIFKFERTCQQMSKDEIHWMFEHWPRLRAGNGSFDRNTARSKMLEKYFKELLDKRN